MGRMTAPQHRAQLTDRVQRLEAAAFTLGADVADIKSAVEQLPQAIRQEVLEYTEPVFGEIMAGRATLATRKDVEGAAAVINATIRAVEARMDDRLAAIEEGMGQILAALGKSDS
jgi:hypothetical protein